MEGAAGAGSDPIGVDDVFKTYLYKGNGGANTINNGIDLSGTGGGLVWLKNRERSTYASHMLFDTERGSTKYILSDSDAAEATSGSGTGINTFNNNGFSLQGNGYGSNYNTEDFVSWSFKKQEKFFTIVEWQGDGTTSRTINHDLGSIPGCIMIKRTDAAGTWIVYHRGLADHNEAYTYAMQGLDNWGARVSYSWLFQSAPTATSFEIGSGDYVNYNTGGTQGQYVAYLFAHEEAEFGPNSDQKIISCGNYTGTGSAGNTVTLPFEPQYLLIKRTTSQEDWMVFDSMRGIVSGANDASLRANSTNVEGTSEDWIDLTSTGFIVQATYDHVNDNGNNYIYLAIAASTGKTSKVPENGTDVFGMDHGNGSSTNFPNFDSTFPVDFALNKVNQTTGTGDWHLSTRISEGYVLTNTDAQAQSGSWAQFDSSVGWALSDSYGASSSFSHMWKRYAGLDCLHYQGTGSARTISHNLGADNVPEMIWIKRRNFWQGQNWVVGHKGLNDGTNPWNYYLVLNGINAEAAQSAFFNDTAPTSSVFSLGSSGGVNANGSPFTAILFSSVEGISKLGYYDGSSSSQTISTGFAPRFVLIKRVNAGYNWYLLDTTRGWGSGNDAQLELNTNNAQASWDFGAPTSTGFTLTVADSYNTSGGKYIYYAHA